METWDREKLYLEVWAQPLTKVAPKYGISSVALGKVCNRLQIPTPGRGYWIKKECGKHVEQLPLPPGRNVPVVQRVKFPSSDRSTTVSADKEAGETPRDVEYQRIVEFESRQIKIDPLARWHPIVKSAERILEQARLDNRGILEPPVYGEPCLDLRVSKESLKRGLKFVNALISALDAEGFSVSVKTGKRGTSAKIFGHDVHFALTESARVIGHREVKEFSHWVRKVVDYKPTGILEFRIGEYYSGETLRDGKHGGLEKQLSACVAALMRAGRSAVHSARLAAQREIERAARERERQELAKLISAEEKRIEELENWVTKWQRAVAMRGFISALEKNWHDAGHDLSPESEKGQRIVWMKQQADRLDPFLPSPPSILDRKRELNRWD
jgi:hypothetical protein